MTRRCKKPKLETAAVDSIPHQITRINSCSMKPPSVYLVVGHGVAHPAYSVFKVNPFPRDAGDTPVPFPFPLARLDAKLSMSFVPVRSRHGPWIVGVGGNTVRDYAPETIVYDIKTRDMIPGPKLSSTKSYPVVLPVGDRIYALTRTPSYKSEVNFVPWFEVLDLSRAKVIDGQLKRCQWRPLPHPPFFPWELTPRQYIFPPRVIVKSYVAVGPYILVSVTGQAGTHMFDTETEQWAKLDDEDLPFAGGATPHGPLFLGISRASKAITLYKITICIAASAAPSPSVKAECTSLSIAEFRVVAGMEPGEQVVTCSRFVSLGNHDKPGFCSFTCRSNDPAPSDFQHTQELVTMRTCTSESQDQLESIDSLLFPKQWEQVYSICDLTRRLSSPCLETVVSL